MIRKLSLFSRMIVGTGLFLVLILGVGVWGIHEIQDLSGITTKFYEHPFSAINATREIKHAIATRRADILVGLLAGDPRAVDQAAEQLAAMDSEIQEHFRLLAERCQCPREKVLHLRESYGHWKSDTGVMLSLFRQGKQDEARQYLREAVLPRGEEANRAAEAIIAACNEASFRYLEEARQRYPWGIRSLGLMVAAALILAAAGAAMFMRSVILPMKRLTEISRDLARGRSLKEQPVSYTDELGQLEQSLNALIAFNNQVMDQARTVACGDYTEEITLRSDEDILGISLRIMNQTLADRHRKSDAEHWLKSGQNQLSARMRGNQELPVLAREVMSFLAEWLHGQAGCLYLVDHMSQLLRLRGCYALADGEAPGQLELGQGLPGQAAVDCRILVVSDIPAHYLRLGSFLGDTPPRHLLVVPFLFEDEPIGVFELTSLTPFSDLEQEFVTRIRVILGQGFNLAIARREMMQLLSLSQEQAGKLRRQQEELAVINEDLEEHAIAMEEERRKAFEKNLELEAAQVQLEQQALELARMNQCKSDFLANMSHELRTPLNSMLLLSRDLRENRGGNLTDEQVESAEVIQRSGMDLLRLINDILDLAKIEAGRLEILLEEVSLQDLAVSLKSRFASQFHNKGIELRVEFARGAPEIIVADQQRLEQIVNNLLANALKFTEKGEVRLTFAPGGDRADRSVEIRVRDTGIGIPEDKLEGIFDSFKQAESDTARRFGGTGLGLAIARNLAGLMGGIIEAESEVGAGSTFTLCLPHRELAPRLPAPEPVHTAVVAAPALPDFFPGKTVLIVDDDMRNLFSLARVLEQHGFTVHKAEDGERALAILDQSTAVDIILMDIMMPKINGYDTTRAIRERGISIPIIALTAKAMQEDRDRCLEAGVDDYLAKPVDVDILLATMRRRLSG